MRLTMAAEAEKSACADRGDAMRAQAQAEADADKIRTMALRIRHEIEAEGARLMNETHNMLTPDARMSLLRMRLVDKMEGIIRESVKPMERIEGIKILHVDGLGGAEAVRPTGHGRRPGGQRRQQSALRFRAQAPLVDQLLREIGVQAASSARSRRAWARLRCRAAGKSGRRVDNDSCLYVERDRRPADAVWRKCATSTAYRIGIRQSQKSRIEAGAPSDRIGCVRNFRHP